MRDGRATGADRRRLFAGSYTDGADEGIYAIAFDESRLRLGIEHVGGHAPNPSFLVRSGSLLHAAHELDDRGCLAAYRIADDGSLSCRGACSSPQDAGTCFVAVHPHSQCLYGANYLSGSVGLCALSVDGTPCGGLPSVRHAGLGPIRARQASAHVHSASFVPGTNLLAVVDLGCDTVSLYRADVAGALVTPPVETVRAAAGSGPRMLAFHPRLPLAALVNELANDVALYRFGATGLGWQQVGRLELPVVPGDVRAAHPAFSPDGRRLYVSVRGSDRLCMFQVDERGGVSGCDDFPSGGRGPRHFALSPAGDFLAVANQDSDAIVLFALDAATGTPHEIARLEVSQPSCVAWA